MICLTRILVLKELANVAILSLKVQLKHRFHANVTCCELEHLGEKKKERKLGGQKETHLGLDMLMEGQAMVLVCLFCKVPHKAMIDDENEKSHARQVKGDVNHHNFSTCGVEADQ